MRKIKDQLKAGAVLSYINLGLSSLIPFFYTPIMLKLLGNEEYGLYSLSSSTIGYLSLLSFGFGGTILRYLTIYRAKEDKKQEESVLGFFIILYGIVAILIFIGGIIISNNVKLIFSKGLTADELAKMQILVIIMAFSSAISFPISIFSSVIMAHERYIFRKCVDMLSTVIAPVGNLIALYCGFASVGMAMVSVIIQFTMLPINMIYCVKVLHVRPRFCRIPIKLIKEMLGFSAFVFIGTIVDMLFWGTDKVLLGMYASTTAVTIYNIGATFNNMVLNLSTAISNVLTTRITNMVAKEATNEQLTDIFIKVGRLQYVVVALMVTGFSVFGQSFIQLWAGDGYQDAYWIAVLTLFPLCIPLIQNTGLSIITAQNRHQLRSVIYLIIAVINVIASYLVIPSFGGIGAAACSGIAYFLGQGIFMNLYYWKAIGINIPMFWKNIGKMSVVPGIMLIIGICMSKKMILDNWWSFFSGVIIYTVIYFFMTYKFTLNEYEKRTLKVSIKF